MNDGDAQKILKAYLRPDGSLRLIPAKRAKRGKVLLHLLQAFETGANYTEKEVNEILRRFHADTAALRRYLADENLLARESDGSRYWRIAP